MITLRARNKSHDLWMFDNNNRFKFKFRFLPLTFKFKLIYHYFIFAKGLKCPTRVKNKFITCSNTWQRETPVSVWSPNKGDSRTYTCSCRISFVQEVPMPSVKLCCMTSHIICAQEVIMGTGKATINYTHQKQKTKSNSKSKRKINIKSKIVNAKAK